jgi:uncharacterized damage-inducible protein DinB
MEVKSIKEFIKYYGRTREATNNIIRAIPCDKINWTYQSGKFTIADLVRHIAAIERNVFMEVIQGNKPCYAGCGKEIADGHENIIFYFNKIHSQSIEILSSMHDDDLLKPAKTLDGKQTTAGNFLRALIVHEVHHRGVLCIYLNLIAVKTPPVIGLYEEDVIKLSK